MPLVIDTSHQSPNHSSRGGRAITMLVIHATVGSYASSLAWLCNPASRVSSHYLISKQGHIAQLVPDDRMAWHAGVSLWNGETAINDVSLGIELENLTGMEMPDGSIHPPDPYPDVQLAAARALVQTKMQQYRVPLSRVLRHLDVAMPRGRKTDPANLDWPAFLASLTTPPRYQAGPYGAIAQQDRRPDAPTAKYYAPGEAFEGDGEQAGYVHDRTGIGFVPLGQVVRM